MPLSYFPITPLSPLTATIFLVHVSLPPSTPLLPLPLHVTPSLPRHAYSSYAPTFCFSRAIVCSPANHYSRLTALNVSSYESQTLSHEPTFRVSRIIVCSPADNYFFAWGKGTKGE